MIPNMKKLLLCSITFVLLFAGTVYAADKEIVLCSWGGTYETAVVKAMVEPFEQETGIKVIVTSYADFAKMKAMVDTGNIEWDVVDIEDRMLHKGMKEGLFEPLDYTVIDKTDLLPQSVHSHAVGIEFWGGVLAYNTEKYPGSNHPNSWADFWDVKKFPGSRALFNGPYDMIEIALLADGVPIDKLYPLDVDRAFKSLDRIKPHIAVWWTKGAQPAQLMTDGEVDMTYAYSGRIANIMKDGIPAGISFNQASVNPEWLVILKGSKKVKEAMQFIAYCTRPKPQAEFNTAMQYGPINKKAFELMPKEVADRVPTSPNYEGMTWMPKGEWWIDRDKEITERWKSWILN